MGNTIRHWSTEAVAERQRMAYWLDSICHSFLEMKSLPTGKAQFFGSIRQSAVGAVVVNEVLGTAQVVNRTPLEIANGSANYYYLITQLDSPWRIRHGGHDVQMQPGDSVLVDSRMPYEFSFPTGLHHLSLQLPIDWVGRWLAHPVEMIGRPIDGSRGWGAALRTFKEALTPEFACNPGFQPALLTDQLGVLMGLALDGPPAPTPHLKASHARALSTMRECLSDAYLVAQAVAERSALSLRSLHRGFAAQGQTFAGVLREMRVAAAQRMLSDRRFARLTVADIAQRCGYADASHFRRQFSRATGVPPSVFRARAGR